MTGVSYTVEFDHGELAAQLSAMVERMDSPIGFYKAVGEYMTEEAIPRNFDSEAAPDGTPWARLSPVTVKRREKAGQVPIRILRASGAMSEVNARFSDDGVRIGTAAKQGAVMQFGAAKGAFGQNAIGRPIPWGDIPARPFLGLATEDEVEIIRLAADWLELE